MRRDELVGIIGHERTVQTLRRFPRFAVMQVDIADFQFPYIFHDRLRDVWRIKLGRLPELLLRVLVLNVTRLEGQLSVDIYSNRLKFRSRAR